MFCALAAENLRAEGYRGVCFTLPSQDETGLVE